MYQKVAQKLANSEMDCTRGDTVNVVLDTPTESIILIETKNDQRTVSLHDPRVKLIAPLFMILEVGVGALLLQQRRGAHRLLLQTVQPHLFCR
jgi:hypothetical protein